jgi:hypothetical protein
MPLYRFALHNGHRLDDEEAAEFLADDEAARQWGLQVIRDLRKNSEIEWKGRTIDVTQDDREVWQIPFIEVV